MKKTLFIVIISVLVLASLTVESLANDTEQTDNSTLVLTKAVTSSEYIRIQPKEIEVGTPLSEVGLDVKILMLDNKQFTLDFDYSELTLDTVGDYSVYTEIMFDGGTSEQLETTISVVDLIAPVIQLVESSVTLEVNSLTPDWKEYVNISDNYYDFNELDIVIKADEVNTNQLGTYNIEVIATDPSENASTAMITVEVEDTTKPYIKKSEPITIEVLSSLGDINFSDYIEFDDNYDEALNQAIDSEAIKLDQLGAYPIVFTVTDSSGNEIVHQDTVHVVDTMKPVIEGAKDIEIDQGDLFDPLQGITATDQYDGDLTSRVKVVSDYDVNDVGKHEIKLEVKDSSGNKSVLTYELTVNRTIVTKHSIRYVLVGALVLTAVVFITRKRVTSKK